MDHEINPKIFDGNSNMNISGSYLYKNLNKYFMDENIEKSISNTTFTNTTLTGNVTINNDYSDSILTVDNLIIKNELSK